MQLTPKTRISDLIEAYPFLVDFLQEVSPKFSMLKNPMLRKTVAKAAGLSQAAAIGGVPLEDLIRRISEKIRKETGTAPDIRMAGAASEPETDPETRHEVLKAIIRDLHDGGDFEDAKKRFAALIRDVDAVEIASMEQKLISEGMPETEVKRLCDVHVRVFQESLESKKAASAPKGHPVDKFMSENRACESLLEKIDSVLGRIGEPPDPESFRSFAKNLDRLFKGLAQIDLHFLRKENQLFPTLEKHGVTGPTQVMWALDDDIRGQIKSARALLEKGDAARFAEAAKLAATTIRDMIYKEERILFPLALETLSPEEWDKVRHGEAEIGYAWVEPSASASSIAAVPSIPAVPAGTTVRIPESGTASAGSSGPSAPGQTAALPFDTGRLTPDQANLILKHLPVDVSFVDEKDEVAYYSDTKERIFPRSAGVIGRKVEHCHPPKSVHVVKKILEDFRAGRRDVAEFWIQLKGQFVHIRYFAVRDGSGAYRGCLEVSQDVTDIRDLKGERRLLE